MGCHQHNAMLATVSVETAGCLQRYFGITRGQEQFHIAQGLQRILATSPHLKIDVEAEARDFHIDGSLSPAMIAAVARAASDFE